VYFCGEISVELVFIKKLNKNRELKNSRQLAEVSNIGECFS